MDMARRKEPVLFVTPGRGKDALRKFAAFLSAHGGEPGQSAEVVCDMSSAGACMPEPVREHVERVLDARPQLRVGMF